MQAIERAVERHQNGDFISSTTLLYLRIEGIMKTYHFAVDNSGRSGQRALYTSATTNLNHPPNVLNTFLHPEVHQIPGRSLLREARQVERPPR